MKADSPERTRDSWHPIHQYLSPKPCCSTVVRQGTQGARSLLAAFARSQSLERARPCAFLSLQGQGCAGAEGWA